MRNSALDPSHLLGCPPLWLRIADANDHDDDGGAGGEGGGEGSVTPYLQMHMSFAYINPSDPSNLIRWAEVIITAILEVRQSKLREDNNLSEVTQLA